MCVRSRAVESCPVLCESVTFLTRFSAYSRPSYKKIGFHVLIDFAVCQVFSMDNSGQKLRVWTQSCKLSSYVERKVTIVEKTYETGNLHFQDFFFFPEAPC